MYDNDSDNSHNTAPTDDTPQCDTLAQIRWLMYFAHCTLSAWQQPYIDHETFVASQVNLSCMQTDLEILYPITLNDKFLLSFGMTKHLEPLVFQNGKLNKDKLGRLLANLADEDKMCRFVHHYLRIPYIDSLVNGVELVWE